MAYGRMIRSDMRGQTGLDQRVMACTYRKTEIKSDGYNSSCKEKGKEGGTERWSDGSKRTKAGQLSRIGPRKMSIGLDWKKNNDQDGSIQDIGEPDLSSSIKRISFFENISSISKQFRKSR